MEKKKTRLKNKQKQQQQQKPNLILTERFLDIMVSCIFRLPRFLLDLFLDQVSNIVLCYTLLFFLFLGSTLLI